MRSMILSESGRDAAKAFAQHAVERIRCQFTGHLNTMIDPEHGVAWRVKSSEAIRADMRCSTYLFICGVNEYAEFTPLNI